MLLLVGLPVAVSELGDEGTQLICRSLYRKTALQHISLQGGAGVWVLGRGSWMCCPIFFGVQFAELVGCRVEVVAVAA